MATYGSGTYGSGTYGSLGAATYDKTGVAVAGSRLVGARVGGTPVVDIIPPDRPRPVRERPPLRVTIDIETPGGKHYRWAEDEPAAENVPGGLTWSDTMPGGFETMDCTLPRKPGIDYSDLEQLSTIRVLGAGGGIAGEYRLERSPRTSGDEVAISPGAVGWQAHLEDDKSASGIYIDRELTPWTDVPDPRKLILLGLNWGTQSPGVVNDPAGAPTLGLEIQGAWTAVSKPIIEAWYDAGAGNLIGSVYFAWKSSTLVNHATANWSWVVYLSSDSVGTIQQSTIDLAGVTPPSSSTLTATTPRRHAFLQWLYDTGPAGADNGVFGLYMTTLVVLGDHGLTARGTAPNQGFYGSDVVRHAVGRWAPLLNVTTDSVQASSFIIPQLAFREPTTCGEMVRQSTRFGLQDWAIWDNKTFWWHERGAFSKLWRTRVAPAQLDETGPQVDRLWESIIVQFQDVDGSTRTVGPPGSGADVEDASLKDTDPDNPANQLGITRRDILQMGTSTSAGAIEVGRRFLEESQLLDRSGRARVVGHVEDSSGVLHPYWRPRAGDYISFIDAADTSYRRIVRTQKSHADRTCNLDLDAPPEGLKALLERLGVVLVPLGLS